MTTPLSAQITIASTDYSAHLTSLVREASLEKAGATVTMTMKSSFPFASINPWDNLVVYENGVKTLTGYVTHIIPRRAPAEVEVQGMDTFKRCQDWFISDNLYTGGPDAQLTTDKTTHNVGYYVGYLCNLCGISYSISDTSGSLIKLAADIPLGLRSVSDALVTLSAVGQWNIRVDPNGVLRFDHINGPTVADYTLSSVTHFEEEYNDTDTRNQVKIWGLQDFSPLTSGSAFSGGGQILWSESRAVTGVSHTRTMVVAEPHIDTLLKAQQLAKAVLDQWARLEHLLSTESVGNPNIRVGQSAQLFHRSLTSGSYFDVVTDLRTTINAGGYKQDITEGRRAYRYPYWPMPTTPPEEWGNGTLLGAAYDCAVYGDSIYSAGLVFLNNDIYRRQCWHIERRLLTDGTLVWQKTIDHVTLNPLVNGGNVFAHINGIEIANGIIFATGVIYFDELNARAKWQVEAYDTASGNTLWTDTILYGPSNGSMETTGYDVVATATQVFVLGTYPYEIPNPTMGGTLIIDIAAPTFRVYAAATTKTVLISQNQPVRTAAAFDGTIFTTPYSNFRQICLDADGGLVTSGAYKYYYQKTIVPVYWPPIIAYYNYTIRPWFGHFSSSLAITWETLWPYSLSDLNFGIDYAVGVDQNEVRQYRLGSDSANGTDPGGLGKYNQVSNLWQTNIGFGDQHGHVEIGNYVYIAQNRLGANNLRWHNTSDGSLIGTRDESGLTTHGIKLIQATSQVGLCGQKNWIFWTVIWNQPS